MSCISNFNVLCECLDTKRSTVLVRGAQKNIFLNFTKAAKLWYQVGNRRLTSKFEVTLTSRDRAKRGQSFDLYCTGGRKFDVVRSAQKWNFTHKLDHIASKMVKEVKIGLRICERLNAPAQNLNLLHSSNTKILTPFRSVPGDQSDLKFWG